MGSSTVMVKLARVRRTVSRMGYSFKSLIMQSSRVHTEDRKRRKLNIFFYGSIEKLLMNPKENNVEVISREIHDDYFYDIDSYF